MALRTKRVKPARGSDRAPCPLTRRKPIGRA
jgi:hypothetical protein